MSNYLQPHGWPNTRLPCPSLSPRVCSNSSPLTWWCYPTISSSVIPPPPALNISQHQSLFQWVGSSHQVAKVLYLQLQHQSFQWIFRTNPLGLGGLISAVQGTLKSLLQHNISKASILWHSVFSTLTSIHKYWKSHSFD